MPPVPDLSVCLSGLLCTRGHIAAFVRWQRALVFLLFKLLVLAWIGAWIWHLHRLLPGELLFQRLGASWSSTSWSLSLCMSLLGFILVFICVILFAECHGIPYNQEVLAAAPCYSPTCLAFAPLWSDTPQLEEVEVDLHHTAGSSFEGLEFPSSDCSRNGVLFGVWVAMRQLSQDAFRQGVVLRSM